MEQVKVMNPHQNSPLPLNPLLPLTPHLLPRPPPLETRINYPPWILDPPSDPSEPSFLPFPSP